MLLYIENVCFVTSAMFIFGGMQTHTQRQQLFEVTESSNRVLTQPKDLKWLFFIQQAQSYMN